LEANQNGDIDVYDSVRMLQKAWQIHMSPTTISNCWIHVGLLPRASSNITSVPEPSLEVLEEVSSLMDQLNGLSLQSEGIECNMSAHEYVHYELEFDLNNPCVPTEEEAWELIVPDIYEDVEESNTCPEIVVPRVLFFEVERSLVTIQNFLEQQEDVFAIASRFSSLHKQISTMRTDVVVQTTLDAYFQAC
jgi:hypothetical protein